MSDSNFDAESIDSSGELLRLSLARLSKLKLPITPVNYALIYFYFSGEDTSLNEEIDELFEQQSKNTNVWTEEIAQKLFDQYICKPSSEVGDKDLREELLSTVANILGMLIDLAGKTAISNVSLEKHVESLSLSKEPGDILSIASDIITETRKLVEETKNFESTLIESTQEIEILKLELVDARKQANKDALTGLNNRRGFDAALIESIEGAHTESTSFCLLLIDIDLFKAINDTYGHLVGDKVLVGLSKVLEKHVRGSDHLSRYGGEEFALILRDTLITGAFSVAENLRKSIERLRLKHVKTGQKIGKVTISVGVASFRKGESALDLINRCDNALYRAKTLGRNRSVIAD